MSNDPLDAALGAAAHETLEVLLGQFVSMLPDVRVKNPETGEVWYEPTTTTHVIGFLGSLYEKYPSGFTSKQFRDEMIGDGEE